MSNPPPTAGYETRDVRPVAVLAVGLLLLFAAGWLGLILFGVYRAVLPPTGTNGVGVPASPPGEPPLADRVESVPPPRLERLGPGSPAQRPEDLRADRQPQLNGYAWVEKGKVARIPIDRAMDAVVAGQAKAPAKKEGGR